MISNLKKPFCQLKPRKFFSIQPLIKFESKLNRDREFARSRSDRLNRIAELSNLLEGLSKSITVKHQKKDFLRISDIGIGENVGEKLLQFNESFKISSMTTRDMEYLTSNY